MNEITVFDNPNFGKIRTVLIGKEPYFCAVDVSLSLGYSNPRDAVIRYCKGVEKFDTPTAGGIQPISYIPESDIYRMVMRSTLPTAERFQDWVVDEVLPTIRKTGGYVANEDKFIETYLSGADPLVQNLFKSSLMALREQNEQIKELKPKADFYDTVADSKDAISMQEVAKVLNIPGMGRTNLFKWLREHKILINSSNNFPYQEYIERGYFRVIENPYFTPSGETIIKTKTLVYQKGVDYIRRRLADDGYFSSPDSEQSL